MAVADADGRPLVEKILDAAGQKGTGKWTGINSLDLGIPVTLITEAVYARALSALKDERMDAAKILKGPKGTFKKDARPTVENIRKALVASKIVSYAQGFMLMREASRECRWQLDFGNIALLWRSGCILRSVFLERIKAAYDRRPNLANLLLDDYFRGILRTCQASWRRVVAGAVQGGIPVPAFSASLAFYDRYRSERLPANLLQALPNTLNQEILFRGFAFAWLWRAARSRTGGAVAGLILILVNGVNVYQRLNQEAASVMIQPTLTPTPLVVAVVLILYTAQGAPVPEAVNRARDLTVQALKYGHQLALATWFGHQLAERLVATDHDLLLPLPLHPLRLRTRGFNQSLEIARTMSKALGLPLATNSLIRVRATPPQAELPLKERGKNVRGAFEGTGDLTGKRILLVDDVMTTGSTLREAARILKLHGAGEITVAVAARALRN